MSDVIKSALFAVFIGIAIMSGMRIAEWAIPKPDTRVFVCFVSNGETDCESIDKLKSMRVMKEPRP